MALEGSAGICQHMRLRPTGVRQLTRRRSEVLVMQRVSCWAFRVELRPWVLRCYKRPPDDVRALQKCCVRWCFDVATVGRSESASVAARQTVSRERGRRTPDPVAFTGVDGVAAAGQAPAPCSNAAIPSPPTVLPGAPSATGDRRVMSLI
jgi:hypothetical protein